MRRLPKLLLAAAPAALTVGLSASPALAADPVVAHQGCRISAPTPLPNRTVKFTYACARGHSLRVTQQVYDFDGPTDPSDLMSSTVFAIPGGSGSRQVVLPFGKKWDGATDRCAEVYQRLQVRVFGPGRDGAPSGWLYSQWAPVRTW